MGETYAADTRPLLTGQPTLAEATVQETLERICSQDPIPPSQVNPDVSPNLDAVCLKCLRKNPFRRYHRAYDLATRLRHLLECTGVRTASEAWGLTRRPPGNNVSPRTRSR